MRALAEEVDEAGGAEARDALLRGVGRRMAHMQPLTSSASIEMFECEINDMLAAIGWGSASVRVSEVERALIITHRGLPRIGGHGDPPGTWLSALLEGLYEGWLSQMPGSDASLVTRRERVAPGSVTIRYGRL